MIDIKILNAETEETKKRLASRNPKLAELADKVLEEEKAYKAALLEVETLRAKRNELSKKIGAVRAKEGPEAAQAVMEEANKLKEAMQGKEQEVSALKDKITQTLMTIPNLPDASGIDPHVKKPPLPSRDKSLMQLVGDGVKHTNAEGNGARGQGFHNIRAASRRA